MIRQKRARIKVEKSKQMEEDPLAGDHGWVMTGFLLRISLITAIIVTPPPASIELTSPGPTLHSGFLSGSFLVNLWVELRLKESHFVRDMRDISIHVYIPVKLLNVWGKVMHTHLKLGEI